MMTTNSITINIAVVALDSFPAGYLVLPISINIQDIIKVIQSIIATIRKASKDSSSGNHV